MCLVCCEERERYTHAWSLSFGEAKFDDDDDDDDVEVASFGTVCK